MLATLEAIARARTDGEWVTTERLVEIINLAQPRGSRSSGRGTVTAQNLLQDLRRVGTHLTI